MNKEREVHCSWQRFLLDGVQHALARRFKGRGERGAGRLFVSAAAESARRVRNVRADARAHAQVNATVFFLGQKKSDVGVGDGEQLIDDAIRAVADIAFFLSEKKGGRMA